MRRQHSVMIREERDEVGRTVIYCEGCSWVVHVWDVIKSQECIVDSLRRQDSCSVERMRRALG